MRHVLIVIASLAAGAGALLGVKASIRTLQVHPGLPPLEIRILPDGLPADAGSSPHRVGHVQIAHRGESKPFQILEVTGSGGPDHLASFSRFEDVNFDGYTDLLLGHDGGAKWVGYDIYLYDPPSSTFVQNDLSRDMSRKLTGQTLELHPATKQIEVTHLPVGCQTGFVASELFAIQDTRLLKVQEKDHLRTQQGCYAVKREPQAGGGMKEVSRERVPGLDHTPG